VLLLGLQHAREWISGMSVMFAAEQLLWQSEGDESVAALLNSVEILAMPVVNPDGCMLLSDH
jgi:murein tripeptide amidase MpaA